MHTYNTAKVAGGNVCKRKRTRDIDINTIISKLKKKIRVTPKKSYTSLECLNTRSLSCIQKKMCMIYIYYCMYRNKSRQNCSFSNKLYFQINVAFPIIVYLALWGTLCKTTQFP